MAQRRVIWLLLMASFKDNKTSMSYFIEKLTEVCGNGNESGVFID